VADLGLEEVLNQVLADADLASGVNRAWSVLHVRNLDRIQRGPRLYDVRRCHGHNLLRDQLPPRLLCDPGKGGGETSHGLLIGDALAECLNPRPRPRLVGERGGG
jgi:hypothetical protein